VKKFAEGTIKSRIRLAYPVEHGGPDAAELRRYRLNPDEVLDFSICTNPFGPSPRVYEALASVPLDKYPDRECLALRTALAECHSISPQQILAGSGVSELIALAALAFINVNRRALVVGPTYGEYARRVFAERLCRFLLCRPG
jgi:histidinol-phosphate/aromatic aminotransferase/cobyric acid decarboxylase-like protein